jgi:hypothetical protein
MQDFGNGLILKASSQAFLVSKVLLDLIEFLQPSGSGRGRQSMAQQN